MVARERGVTVIHDNLAVVPARERSDAEITKDIPDVLESHARVHKEHIALEVEMGRVTLFGNVPDKAARGHINDTVAGVAGVVELKDRMTVAAEKETE